jgi:hypothetical protein
MPGGDIGARARGMQLEVIWDRIGILGFGKQSLRGIRCGLPQLRDPHASYF